MAFESLTDGKPQKRQLPNEEEDQEASMEAHPPRPGLTLFHSYILTFELEQCDCNPASQASAVIETSLLLARVSMQ